MGRFLFILTVTSLAFPSLVFPQTKVGTVAWLTGRVVAFDGQKSFPLAEGDIIYKGYNIKTEKRSKVEITLLDKSSITLDEFSELSIDDFYFNKDEETRNVNARYRYSIFDIRTSSAVAGVKGTDFGVWATSDEASFAFCVDGEIVVSNEFGEVVLIPGTMTLVILGAPPMPPSLIDKNIQNFLENLESKSPDFSVDNLALIPAPPPPSSFVKPIGYTSSADVRTVVQVVKEYALGRTDKISADKREADILAEGRLAGQVSESSRRKLCTFSNCTR